MSLGCGLLSGRRYCVHWDRIGREAERIDIYCIKDKDVTVNIREVERNRRK